jgi:voltage-gated potassium channel
MLTGMLAVAADATRDETLHQVGIERARGLVAALATDADNLFVLLSAKGLNPKLYVAARAAEEGAEEKMRRAGADAVFAPYSITGHRLAQSLLRPHVVQFLDFTTKDIAMDIAIEQVRVSAGSEVAAKTIREMQLRRNMGVIVMAIRRRDGNMLFNPPADTAVEAGDYLIVMGKQEDLTRSGRAGGGPWGKPLIVVPVLFPALARPYNRKRSEVWRLMANRSKDTTESQFDAEMNQGARSAEGAPAAKQGWLTGF